MDSELVPAREVNNKVMSGLLHFLRQGNFRGFYKGKSFIHRFPVFVSAFARLMRESLVRTLNLICNFYRITDTSFKH